MPHRSFDALQITQISLFKDLIYTRCQRTFALADAPSSESEASFSQLASGEYRVRTDDLLVANQALSQLS